MERAQLPLVWMGKLCAATLILAACYALWQLSIESNVSDTVMIGVLALGAVALPVMFVLWRWSRS